MRKLTVIVLSLLFVFAAVGCSKNSEYAIKIVVPTGSAEEFVYSEEEISPYKNEITVSSGEGLSDTEVVLKPVEAKEENFYQPAYLTPGMPVKMEAEKKAWFKVGVAVQNPTEEDILVYVNIQGIEVRMQ